MYSNRFVLLVGAVVLVLTCTYFWCKPKGPRASPHVTVVPAPQVQIFPAQFAKLQQQLTTGSPALDVGERLAEIARTLLATSRVEAVSALIALLNSGMDAPTGLAFKLGPGGKLTSTPTLRVWMLDQLGWLDSAVAADYAAHIYARHDSADEWAVALRDDWREAAPAGRIERVRARALELLNDTEWARQPSVGFLEAFDVSVATMAWEAVPTLERWLDPGQPRALRGAAWVALDRITMEVPEDFLPMLAQNREWLASQSLLRAGLMARADLGVERERHAVETYLQRDDILMTEGRRFFELLPNVSATVSYNLVTTARTPTPKQAAGLDRAALTRVREWRADPRFSRWNSELSMADIRLSESVASAIRGGHLEP